MSSLGKRLEETRKIARLSQETLAGLLGVSRRTVGSWEADENTPQGSNLLQIERVLEVQPAWLVSGETPKRSSLPATFGQRLIRAMKDGSLTPSHVVKGIAKLCKITEEELRDWMADKAEPPMEVKLQLASHLGVPLRWLVGNEEPSTKEMEHPLTEGLDPRALLVALELVEEACARANAPVAVTEKAQATVGAYGVLVKMGLEHREAVRDLLATLLNLT